MKPQKQRREKQQRRKKTRAKGVRYIPWKGWPQPAGADITQGVHLDRAPGICLPLCTEAAPGDCGELPGMYQRVNFDNAVNSGLASVLGLVPLLWHHTLQQITAPEFGVPDTTWAVLIVEFEGFLLSPPDSKLCFQWSGQGAWDYTSWEGSWKAPVHSACVRLSSQAHK